MEDIEDMFKSEAMEDQPATRSKRVNKVARSAGLKKARAAKAGTVTAKEEENSDEIAAAADEITPALTDVLPGKAKIMIKTFGCSHNISDSEYMAGLLHEYGFTIVDHIDEAEACLINSCTVKNPSQEKFINLVGKAQK